MIKKAFLTAAAIISIATSCSTQNSNTFSHKVGSYEVILLSEGQTDNKPDKLIDASPQILEETLTDGTYKASVNAFLVKSPDKIYLIDTGLGNNLWSNLDAVGVSPEQIDEVILTHLHGDHTGGMLRDGKIAFPNANITLSAKEYDYWINEKKHEKSINIIKAYNNKISAITPAQLSEKQNDGVHIIEAYGHTPGHIICLIQSNGEELLVWADLTHAMAVQMPYPEIALVYDTNPEMAIATRKRVLEYVAKTGTTVAGMHIAYPAMGKVQASPQKGYKFTPCK